MYLHAYFDRIISFWLIDSLKYEILFWLELKMPTLFPFYSHAMQKHFQHFIFNSNQIKWSFVKCLTLCSRQWFRVLFKCKAYFDCCVFVYLSNFKWLLALKDFQDIKLHCEVFYFIEKYFCKQTLFYILYYCILLEFIIDCLLKWCCCFTLQCLEVNINQRCWQLIFLISFASQRSSSRKNLSQRTMMIWQKANILQFAVTPASS